MPKLQNMSVLHAPGNYKFSATDLDYLGSSEYTLVSVICDVSSSVFCFKTELIDCLKAVLSSCHHSPRAQQLMLRLCSFNNELKELHGFVELDQLDSKDYDGILNVGGYTALYDATHEAIEATGRYGKALADRDFNVNAIVFVITDGEDNASRKLPHHIKEAINQIRSKETLESLTTVLIGVTANQNLSSYLRNFSNDAGLDECITLEDAGSDALASLAGFMSRSICMTSQILSSSAMPLTI